MERIALSRPQAQVLLFGWPVPLALLIVGAIAGGGLALALGMVLLGVGALIYIREADRDRPQGMLWGALRGWSAKAFRLSRPWDVCGALLVLRAAFFS